MRGSNDSGSPAQPRVQFARGHWAREEQAGAARSVGWWESVTVTWSPAPAPGHRPAVLRRALATAADMIVPALADLAIASAGRFLERQRRARPALPSSRRHLPPIAGELPRPDRTA